MQLVPVKALFDGDFAVLLHRDNTMNALEPRQRNVDDIVARIQIKLYRRKFIQNAIVDGDLRTLRLRLDHDCTHSGGVAAAKELLELATNLDVVGIAQRPQARRQAEGLPDLQIRSAGLVQISLLLEREAVVPRLVHGDLRGRGSTSVFAIHPNGGARWITGH